MSRWDEIENPVDAIGRGPGRATSGRYSYSLLAHSRWGGYPRPCKRENPTPQLARRLGVERTWVDRRVDRGRIPAERHPLTGNDLIADDPVLIEQLAATLRRTRNVSS